MDHPSSTTVSVIIPCYRQAHYLTDSVGSALQQIVAPEVNVEVVVVDDGSPDNTAEVAASFGDRIRYVRRENGGLPAARNTGIRSSIGEFIVFLDADDMLSPGGLAAHLQAVRVHPDAALFYGGHRVIDASGAVLAEHPAPALTPFDPFHGLLKFNIAPPVCFLVRRAILSSVGFFAENSDYYGVEDWDLWLRIAAAGHPIARVPAIVALYRQLQGSMSTKRARMIAATLAVLRSHCETHGNCRRCLESKDAAMEILTAVWFQETRNGSIPLIHQPRLLKAFWQADSKLPRRLLRKITRSVQGLNERL